MFIFHFGARGDTVTIHGEGKRHAIKRFQELMGEVPFQLDEDYRAKRHSERERLIAIAAEAEAQKYEAESIAA